MDAATRAKNDATQRMAADSRQMTIATWVGVALLVLILFLTLMANLAAVKAVWVTREIGEKQVRPYLAFKIKNISAIPSDVGRLPLSSREKSAIPASLPPTDQVSCST